MMTSSRDGLGGALSQGQCRGHGDPLIQPVAEASMAFASPAVDVQAGARAACAGLLGTGGDFYHWIQIADRGGVGRIALCADAELALVVGAPAAHHAVDD